MISNAQKKQEEIQELLSRLVMFRDFGENSILGNIAEALGSLSDGSAAPFIVTGKLSTEVHRLLELSTAYALRDNLWQGYLTYLLLMNENPLSLTLEMRRDELPGDAEGAADRGSAVKFAREDMKIFRKLFFYDFSSVEEQLGIRLFSAITNYHAIPKRREMYNRRASDEINLMRSRLEEAARIPDEEQATEAMWAILEEGYRANGVGYFGLNRVFRTERKRDGIHFLPLSNISEVHLDDLIGYEFQKKLLRENTEAFVSGHKANNCLLFGDSGTGKSTSIKALVTEYQDKGLRMIELYKHQCRDLAGVIGQIKDRNYKFIIYMDDLSFEEDETEYKYLKAVIEGGLETRPDNVLIYATSNRRNLIRETWNDTNDLELDKHHSDTVQEKLSLVQRFGITIGYVRPNQKDYFRIVTELAAKHPEITLSEAELLREATKWSVSHGGMTGRAAQQLIDHLL